MACLCTEMQLYVKNHHCKDTSNFCFYSFILIPQSQWELLYRSCTMLCKPALEAIWVNNANATLQHSAHLAKGTWLPLASGPQRHPLVTGKAAPRAVGPAADSLSLGRLALVLPRAKENIFPHPNPHAEQRWSSWFVNIRCRKRLS